MHTWTGEAWDRSAALKLLSACATLIALGCGGSDVTAPTSGSLEITTSTSGLEPDADGYGITIDGGTEISIAINATHRRDDLEPGSHSVNLVGLATNCTVEGDNPRNVSVPAGATAAVEFTITCGPTTGSLTITTTTSGESQDPDGYSFALDGDATQSIGLNVTLTLPNVAAGAHTLLLSGVAANCRAEGDNPRSVMVVAGAAATTSFNISCSAPEVTHWASIRLGDEFRWTDIWGTSPTDLFVSGWNEGTPVSVIWHYDGQRWTEQLRRSDIRITGIWGSSSTDVFAASAGVDFGSGVILHYNGALWSEMAVPAPRANYNAIWGNSGTDVYARPGLHYDGTSWTWLPEMEAAVDEFGSANLAAGSLGDLYAVGRRDVTEPDDDCNTCIDNYILHHDGTAWTETFTTHDPAEEVRAIWVSGRNDAWVAVSDWLFQVFHFNGTRWEADDFPLALLEDFWGSSSSNIYAVDLQGIVHYDGTSWRQINDTEGSGIWGTSPTDVFVLGQDAVLHGTP